MKKTKKPSHIHAVPSEPQEPKPPVSEHGLDQASQDALKALDSELVQRRLALAELAMKSEELKQVMTQTAVGVQTTQQKLQEAVKAVAERFGIDVESTTEKWTLDLKEMVIRRVQ